MDATEYLEQIEIMDADIEVKEDELERLRALRDKITASYEGERVQTSGSQKKLENCVLKIMQAEEEYAASVESMNSYKKEVLALIKSACDADSIKVLYKRYFVRMEWADIARDMSYTSQWVSGGLHRRALSQLQKALNERSRHDRVAEKEG